jgi:hypothetical protein
VVKVGEGEWERGSGRGGVGEGEWERGRGGVGEGEWGRGSGRGGVGEGEWERKRGASCWLLDCQMSKFPTGCHFSFVIGNQIYPSQIFLGRFGYYKIFLTEIVKWTT